MNIERIIQTIKNDKFQVLDAEDLGFASYSDIELFEIFKLGIKPTHDSPANIGVQIIPKNTENLRKIFDLSKQLNEKNYVNHLSNFQSSFRLHNVQALSKKMAKENNEIFNQAALAFFTNLYFTPSSQHNALELHFDDAHIFVHQIRGQKSWTLLETYKNGEYIREDLSKMDLSDISTGKTEIMLKENQVLYIPTKMPHKAVAMENEHSIHLTYAFREISTKASIVEFVISKMIQDLNFNENKFEVFIDNEASTINRISEYFKNLNVANSVKELAALQKIKKLDILKNGMRKSRR